MPSRVCILASASRLLRRKMLLTSEVDSPKRLLKLSSRVILSLHMAPNIFEKSQHYFVRLAVEVSYRSLYQKSPAYNLTI